MLTKRTQEARLLRPSMVSALVIAACLNATPSAAQDGVGPLWVQDSIKSQVLGETRRLRISLPMGYDRPHFADERFAVLIALDAQWDLAFAATVANARALAHDGSPAIPRLIIVGVETEIERFRDTTPPVPNETRGGGAPAFLSFLQTELRPYIAARYRTNGVTVLTGHSMTGLFATWAFGQAPDFLMGVIALSPSLPIEPIARQALEGISARKTPGRLFLAVGTEHHSMVKAAQSFAAELKTRSAAGREVEFQEVADASHNNMGTLGMVPGLRFIFRPVSLAGHQLERAGLEAGPAKLLEIFESTKEAYLRGARQLGLSERLPLAFLRNCCQGGPKFAPFVLRACDEQITSYPAVSSGYECAADMQQRVGRSEEAAANYQRAIEAAQKAGDTASAERIAAKKKVDR